MLLSQSQYLLKRGAKLTLTSRCNYNSYNSNSIRSSVVVVGCCLCNSFNALVLSSIIAKELLSFATSTSIISKLKHSYTLQYNHHHHHQQQRFYTTIRQNVDTSQNLAYNKIKDREWLKSNNNDNKQVKRVANAYWKDDIVKQRRCLIYIKKHLQLNSAVDWKEVNINFLKQFNYFNASGLFLKQYNKSIISLLNNTYSELNILENIFQYRSHAPKNYWQDINNQKQFLDYISYKYNINELADWKRITLKTIINENGSGLLEKYDHNISDMLLSVYKNNNNSNNNNSKFSEISTAARSTVYRKKVQQNYWSDMDNQLTVLAAIINHLNITNIEHWKKVTYDVIKQFGASSLLSNHYNNNIFNMISTILRYSKSKIENGSHDIDDAVVTISNKWSEEVDAKECRSFMPRHYWSNTKNIEQFIRNDVKNYFDIENEDEWYRISMEQLKQVKGGSALLDKYSQHDLMAIAYPSVQWLPLRFSSHFKKSRQFYLFKQTKRLLSHIANIIDKQHPINILQQFSYPVEVVEDFIHPELSKQTQSNVELDIYIPALQLAFEYQGEHHYNENAVFGSIELQMTRDNSKKQVCHNNGVLLIDIPYWWNGTQQSLANYILDATSATKLQLNSTWKQAIIPALKQLKKEFRSTTTEKVTTTKKLKKEVVMLSNIWNETIDPTGYWISEKYDGIRAIWKNGQLMSRRSSSNTMFNPPKWWLLQLPSHEFLLSHLSSFLCSHANIKYSTATSGDNENDCAALDGELWIGPNTFSQLSVKQLQNPNNDEFWSRVKYKVFDLIPPQSKANSSSFKVEQRLQMLDDLCASFNKHRAQDSEVLQYVQHMQCTGISHLKEELTRVTKQAGEGLVIRKPNAAYEFCRSSASLKVKQLQDDDVQFVALAKDCVGFVCRVLAAEENTNNSNSNSNSNKNSNGAIEQVVRCQLQDYTNPPRAGSILSVKHFGKWESGKFRYPFYYRVREEAC